MKPRCRTCESAMKTTYERVGSKGLWNSIGDWWYCNDCNRMEHLPNIQIAEQEDKYLDYDAAAIYPTIARVRTEQNAPYVEMTELKEAIKPKPSHWIEYKQIKSEFKLSNHKHYHTNDVITKQIEPGWICSKCYYFENIEDTTLVRYDAEDTLMEHIPDHCDQKMRLGNITTDIRLLRYDVMKSNILELCEHEQFQEVRKPFLEYCLELFAELFSKRMIQDFIEFSKFPQLKDTVEFNLLHHLISLFSKNNLHHRFNLVSAVEMNSISMKLTIRYPKEDRQKISARVYSRFEDLKSKILNLNYVKSGNLMKYTRWCWKIQTIIESLSSYGSIPDYSRHQQISDNNSSEDKDH